MRPKFIHYSLLLLLLLTGIQGTAFATILETKWDRHLVKEAELIFQGVVIDVQYKDSTPKDKLPGIPHTFVTFNVEHIFKGDIRSGSTMTLRFEGGVAKDGNIMVVDGIPLFDKGDRGILFVKGNTEQPCPLVGWSQGFYRVANNTDVYSEKGNQIVLADRLAAVSQFEKSDILDSKQFLLRLADPATEIDKLIRGSLSKNTLELLASAGSRELPLLSILTRLLLQDLNRILSIPVFFQEKLVNSLALRDETRDNWKINQSQTDPFKVMRLNRQLLEDAYPSLLVKTPNQIMAWGRQDTLDEVVTHFYTQDIKFRTNSSPDTDKENQPVYIEGKAMQLTDVSLQINRLVQLVATPEELKLLPLVPSADIKTDFYGVYFEPAAPPVDFYEKQ